MTQGRASKRIQADPRAFRSGCPLASALDVVGDRWSLLIIRGLMVGNSRYGDFLKDPERIATNILASRLGHLDQAGLIEQVPESHEQGPHRYRLTRKGADLLPAMQALAGWGKAHLPERWDSPAWFRTGRPSDFYPDEHPARGRRSRQTRFPNAMRSS
jgi:DNA-binding HxlR family transcriptional regulator